MDTKTLRHLAAELGKTKITHMLQKEADRLRLGNKGQARVADLVDELLLTIGKKTSAQTSTVDENT